jgi:hypothetical protein
MVVGVQDHVVRSLVVGDHGLLIGVSLGLDVLVWCVAVALGAAVVL